MNYVFENTVDFRLSCDGNNLTQKERNHFNMSAPLTIIEGALYRVKKDCEYLGCQAKVERVYNGGGIVATVFGRDGEVRGVKLHACDLKSMKVEGDDEDEKGKHEKVYFEKPHILSPKHRLKKAMEENEELKQAANQFVYEMALVGLDDEESLHAVLKKAQNRLWVDNVGYKDEFEQRNEVEKKRKRTGGFVMADEEEEDESVVE